MWTVMVMLDVVVQETLEISKRSGLLGSFDSRRGVLLGRGTVRRWSSDGGVWGDNRVGLKMLGPAADGEAELGGHGWVLCCGGAWLSRTTSGFDEGGFPRGIF
jgi:hypothetical protein